MKAIRKNEPYTTPPTNPPTAADSLFLLNNNREVAKLLDLGYGTDNIDRRNLLENWEKFGFDISKKKALDNLQRDLNSSSVSNMKRSKDQSNYIDTQGDFFGITDYLSGGGDDYYMPTQYIHPGIVPQGFADYIPSIQAIDKIKKKDPDFLQKILDNMPDIPTDASGNVNVSSLPSIATYIYDDLAITPTKHLTPEQRKLRIKLYGNENVGNVDAPTYELPPKPSSQMSDNKKKSSRKTDRIKPIKRRGLPSRPEPELQVREQEPRDKLIDTQAVYRNPLSNRLNIRGLERPLMQTGVKKIYERPDGTRYVTRERFDSDMIKEIDEIKNPAPRIIKAQSFKKGGIIPVKKRR
tara:strand:- start:3347 stop:4402 length:1056 start_codon:yes stop_codon:yes gene_type:complete